MAISRVQKIHDGDLGQGGRVGVTTSLGVKMDSSGRSDRLADGQYDGVEERS